MVAILKTLIAKGQESLTKANLDSFQVTAW